MHDQNKVTRKENKVCKIKTQLTTQIWETKIVKHIHRKQTDRSITRKT